MEMWPSEMELEVNTLRRFNNYENLSGADGGNGSYMDPTGVDMSMDNFCLHARNLITSNSNVNTSWKELLLSQLNDACYTTYDEPTEIEDYIFDHLYVRVIFIVLYSIVFCFCFFGNLMVILVVTLHWRMRNITRFCLANLAFADLCVGVFCVYQNLSTYLIKSWVLGEFLCKMYQFINALSHTAAVLILVVICVERYLAILHPFRAKQIMTINRLRVLIILVWLVSAIYCSPRLYYIVTIETLRLDGTSEIICAAQRNRFNSKAHDIVHFFLLFLVPLLVISILYTRVGITLWRSSKNQLQVTLPQPPQPEPGTSSTNSANPTARRNLQSNSDSEASDDVEDESKAGSSPGTTPLQRKRNMKIKTKSEFPSVRFTKLSRGETSKPASSNGSSITVNAVTANCNDEDTDANSNSSIISKAKSCNKQLSFGGGRRRRQNSQSVRSTLKQVRVGSGKDALRSRQTVVKMMIVVVFTFALFNFPFHLRKMFQYWWPNYDFVSMSSTLATPLSYLLMYTNCAINPVIYAFMSKAFRSSFKDLLRCRWKKSFERGNYH